VTLAMRILHYVSSLQCVGRNPFIESLLVETEAEAVEVEDTLVKVAAGKGALTLS
jgi:hypothetical protein